MFTIFISLYLKKQFILSKKEHSQGFSLLLPHVPDNFLFEKIIHTLIKKKHKSKIIIVIIIVINILLKFTIL